MYLKDVGSLEASARRCPHRQAPIPKEGLSERMALFLCLQNTVLVRRRDYNSRIAPLQEALPRNANPAVNLHEVDSQPLAELGSFKRQELRS